VCEQVRSRQRARRGLTVPRWRALWLALAVSGLPRVASVHAANDLTLAFAQDTCCVHSGEPVTALLRLSNLLQSVNGVQAVLHYDPQRLGLIGITPGDGLGSPWDGALEIAEQVSGPEITYALIRFGGTQRDAVVARLQLLAQAPGPVELALLPASLADPTVETKLSGFPGGNPLAPNLGPPLEWMIATAYGDTDNDGDVDAADFASFVACLSAPAGLGDDTLDTPCCCLDANGDHSVDLADFAAFQRVFGCPLN